MRRNHPWKQKQDRQSFTYIYDLPDLQGEEAYDHAMAAATMQGIINREQPILYILSPWSKMPAYWLDIFGRKGGWLAESTQKKLGSLDDLAALAGDTLRGAVIWDPSIPATVNVTTTIADVEDGVVLSIGGWLPTGADGWCRQTGDV